MLCALCRKVVRAHARSLEGTLVGMRPDSRGGLLLCPDRYDWVIFSYLLTCICFCVRFVLHPFVTVGCSSLWSKGYLTIIAYTIFYLLCSRLHFFRVSSTSFLSCLPAVYSCLQFVLIRQFTNTSGVLRQGEDFCDLKSWFLSGLRHSEASKL